jgi:hypothetical protein
MPVWVAREDGPSRHKHDRPRPRAASVAIVIVIVANPAYQATRLPGYHSAANPRDNQVARGYPMCGPVAIPRLPRATPRLPHDYPRGHLRGYPPWLPPVATPWLPPVATPWLSSLATPWLASVMLSVDTLRGYPPWLLCGYSVAAHWLPSVATLRGYPPWLPPAAALGPIPWLLSVATLRGYPLWLLRGRVADAGGGGGARERAVGGRETDNYSENCKLADPCWGFWLGTRRQSGGILR